MNISDLIVELLQQGKRVDIPGIGAMESVLKEPYHDPKTNTYYPARHTVVFGDAQDGDNTVVQAIAERECVNEDVARQMWNNYVDALTDRIKSNGSHTFMGLGTISTPDKKTFQFRVADDLVLDDDSDDVPLTDVKIYDHAGEEDPFAQFDEEEVPVLEDKPEPELEPVAEPEPEPIVEPEPEPEPEPVVEPEPEPEPVVEPEPELVDEPEPVAANEPEPTFAPEPEPVAEPEPEPVAEPEPEPVVDKKWEGDLDRVDEISKEKDNYVDPKAAAKAEKERRKREKKEEEERRKLEKKAEEERIRAAAEAEKERLAREKQAAEELRRAEEQMRRAEKKAEEERIRAEREAEAARIKAEKKAEEERIKAEKKAEEERIKAEKKAAALAAMAARQQAKAEEQRLKAEHKAEHEAAKAAAIAARDEEKALRKAEQDAAKAAATAARDKEKALRKAEQDAAKAAAIAARDEEKALRKAEKEAAKQAERNRKLADELLPANPYTESHDEDDGRKRHSIWPLILIILLVLLILAGGAYYFLLKRGQGKQPAAVETPVVQSGKHLDVPAYNSLTFNTDMIEYSPRDINGNTDRVCRNMAEYISNYLKDRGYARAIAPMMDRVRQYASDRMADLLADRFAVQRMIPYDDYIYKFNEPCLKAKRANNARIQVQTELMNYSALDDILYAMVDELGLQPGGDTPKTAAEVQQVKTAEKAAADKKAAAAKKKAVSDETPVFVYVSKESKQGFDLIAGFYLNRATAANLTARLHEQGCDAYIIEKNDLFYVSMGSASTRTAAEALFKHVKSWYDGDVVIKEW